VPLVLSSVILRNHAGRCGYATPRWLAAALREPGGSTRRAWHARHIASYLDSDRRRYVHLLDGGISDNLGLRGALDLVTEGGFSPKLLSRIGHSKLREIAVIAVDAATLPTGRFDAIDYAPPLAAVLDAVTSVQLNRYSFETLELVRATLGEAARALSTPERPVGFHLVDVSFDAVADADVRRALNETPTSLSLPDESVDRLRVSAREVLRGSAAFRQLLSALAAESPRAHEAAATGR
jgi:NTE family protein